MIEVKTKAPKKVSKEAVYKAALEAIASKGGQAGATAKAALAK